LSEVKVGTGTGLKLITELTLDTVWELVAGQKLTVCVTGIVTPYEAGTVRICVVVAEAEVTVVVAAGRTGAVDA
jgi:hypothetical protein